MYVDEHSRMSDILLHGFLVLDAGEIFARIAVLELCGP
jgi:hypothetical protein